ncbi:MAG: DUF4834 family protein [Bacteroidia bacterium]|nr:hypothetical protein [Bacteroidia bacterium]MCZ2277771.1 DUF4834 family protein [Bacteroidia bacterium]
MKLLLIVLLIFLGILALRKNTRIIIHRHQNDNPPAKKEGEITLDTSVPRSKPSSDAGEYVEYTEIKD